MSASGRANVLLGDAGSDSTDALESRMPDLWASSVSSGCATKVWSGAAITGGPSGVAAPAYHRGQRPTGVVSQSQSTSCSSSLLRSECAQSPRRLGSLSVAITPEEPAPLHPGDCAPDAD